MPQPPPSRRRALALGLIAPAAAAGSLGAAPEPADEASRASIEARIKVAREIVDLGHEMMLRPPIGATNGGIPRAAVDDILRFSRVIADLRLELAADREGRLAILAEEVKRASDFAGLLGQLVQGESSGLARGDQAKAEFEQLDAEARLAREKANR